MIYCNKIEEKAIKIIRKIWKIVRRKTKLNLVCSASSQPDRVNY